MTSVSNGSTTVTVDLVTAVRFSCDPGREMVGTLVNLGTVGPRKGTLVYLVSSLTAAVSLETLYTSKTYPTATITDTGGALNGFSHSAIGPIRIDSDRNIAGIPCRWAVSVEVVKV